MVAEPNAGARFQMELERAAKSFSNAAIVCSKPCTASRKLLVQMFFFRFAVDRELLYTTYRHPGWNGFKSS
jgi:hypothetical protein